MSLTTFDRHVCLADVSVVNLRQVTRICKVSSYTNKKRQKQNLESFLRLPKNAKTIDKFLAEHGPGSISQLYYRVPTIRIRRI